MWPGPGHAFLGMVDIAYNHTKFDDCGFNRSRDILGGVKF